MIKYSISDLEKLTGIKAHTIRIWEQRYGLLTPLRTATNIRYYDDNQLKKLLNVSTLLRNGIKISHISSMTEEEIHSKLDKVAAELKEPGKQYEIFINQLVSSGLTFNEPQFEKTFSSCLLRFGLQDTYVNVIYPLLDKVGLMWGKDELNPAQEHFVSNLLKQKLFTALDALPAVTSSSKSFVLFLPEEENHEIGLLFANYLLRSYHHKVIYLGQDVPFTNLEETVDFTKPTHLMTFLVGSQPQTNAQKYIDRLALRFKDLEILVSGNPWVIGKLKLTFNIHWVKSVEDFNKFINN